MISIIIVVKNDIRIANTLHGIFLQKKIKDFEVVVVDASAGSLDNIKKTYNTRVNWIDFKSEDKAKRTTVAQINLGCKKSSGDIIVYIDADNVPDEFWLYRLTKPLVDGKEYITASCVKSLNEKSYKDEQWNSLIHSKYVTCCPSMGCAIKREVLDKVGEYDYESFNYGWDVDHFWRCQEAGYKIRYISNAIIYHDWGDNKSEFKRLIHYGQARATLYYKHPQQLKNILNADPISVVYPILILCLPLIFHYPYLIISLLLLVLNNVRRGNPFLIVINHITYGFGVLSGIYRLCSRQLALKSNLYRLPLGHD